MKCKFRFGGAFGADNPSAAEDPRTGAAVQPADPDRGSFLSWLFFTSNALHQAALAMFYPHRPAGEANTDAARAAARTTAATEAP